MGQPHAGSPGPADGSLAATLDRPVKADEDSHREGGASLTRTAARIQDHRTGRDRPGPVRRHDAVRHGGRGAARRPGSRRSRPTAPGRRCTTSSAGAGGPSALTSSTRTDADAVLRLVEQADALIEGFRPGVTERLGIGPDDCLARNPRLVYGRMTGWGQEGPYAAMAGHDINYIALSGTLSMIGRAGETPGPTPQPDRRLRRRRHAARLRRGVRPAGDQPLRTGPGHRRGHGRRGRSAGRHDLRFPGGRRRGGSGVRTSSTPAPGTTTSTRRPTADTCRSARWSRSFSRKCCGSSASTTRPVPDDRATWPAMKERMAALIEDPDPGRVVRAARGQRRLLRARAQPGRGRRATRTTGSGPRSRKWRA